jgi:hypothetical protein
LSLKAADGGHIEILRSLGDNGIKLDQKDNKGRTVAHHGTLKMTIKKKTINFCFGLSG